MATNNETIALLAQKLTDNNALLTRLGVYLQSLQADKAGADADTAAALAGLQSGFAAQSSAIRAMLPPDDADPAQTTP